MTESDDENPSGEERPGLKEEQDDARAQMREFEARDEVPSDPREWPDGKAKFLTFGHESDEPFGEGVTAKLGPGTVEHHEDGSVSVDGEPVDDPEAYKGDPIPGGPTDPNSPDIPGEKRQD